MTLPTSGEMDLFAIKTEFGGLTSPSIFDYYAGGSYVPSGTVSPISGPVPTSGEIGLFNFYGTSSIIESFTMAVGTGIAGFGYVEGAFGSMNHYDFFLGGNISQWYASPDDMVLQIDTTVPNSGWSIMTIDGNDFNKGDATFNGSNTWTWSSVGNPFGVSGTIACSFR